MNKIKSIVVTSILITVIGAIVFLFAPGYKFSCGIIIGGLVSLFDFWLILSTVKMLKPAQEDSKLMIKFALLFIGKTFALLILLAVIVFILTKFSRWWTFGFIVGLSSIPLSIMINSVVFAVKKDK